MICSYAKFLLEGIMTKAFIVTMGVIATFLFAAPAFAQAAADTVQVPWGSWFYNAAVFTGTILTAVVIPAVMKAAGPFAAILQMARVDQLLEKAIAFGVNRVAGASKDAVLNLQIGNDVIREAASYAVRHAPDLVTKMGGEAVIREKILARINLSPDAASS